MMTGLTELIERVEKHKAECAFYGRQGVPQPSPDFLVLDLLVEILRALTEKATP